MRKSEAMRHSAGGGGIRFRVDPRLVPSEKAARRLGVSSGVFSAMLPTLLREGFPNPCNVTGNYDLVAIEAWLDRRAGLGGRETRHDIDGLINSRLSALNG